MNLRCHSVGRFGFLLIWPLWLLDTAPGISASPSEDNMRYFNVMILGPTQSPYEGSVASEWLLI